MHDSQIEQYLKLQLDETKKMNKHLIDIKILLWFVEPEKKVIWETYIERWPANAIEMMAEEIRKKEEAEKQKPLDL